MNLVSDEKRIRRYLMAELDETEHTAIDEAILADDELFELVQAIEEELIEEYVAEDMSDDERERYERHFLTSSGRRRRTEVARLLREGAEPVKVPAGSGSRGPGKSNRARWARLPMTMANLRAAASIVALAAVSGGVWWGASRLSPSRWADAPEPGPSSPAVPDPGSVLAVTLRPGGLRGAQAEAPMVQGPEVVTIRLLLELEAGSAIAPDLVSVETPEGQAVWTAPIQASPRPAGEPLVVDVPAEALGPGDYLVFLFLDSEGQRQIVQEYVLSIR